MKIYSVYENEIHELEVRLIEEQGMWIVDLNDDTIGQKKIKNPAFNFNVIFKRGDYQETKIGAFSIAIVRIKEQIAIALEEVELLKDKKDKLEKYKGELICT